MQEKPKISVIIPIYNMELYLSKALDSVLAQTLKDIEIICINDGSDDNSGNILNEYKNKYENIKIIDQENHGVGYARNVGINNAAGEYLAFLDPDDYLISDKTYSLLYRAVKEHDVKIAGGSLCEDRDNGKWIRTEFEGIYKKYIFAEEKLIDYKDYQFDFAYYRFIFEREMIIQNKIYFPEYVRFQDPPFFVNAMITAGKFYAIPEFTYCYRYGHHSLELNERKICDYIHGHIDNLRMSSEAELRKLHILTLHRLAHNSRKWLITGIEHHSVEMFDLLSEAQSIVRKEWLNKKSQNVYEQIFVYYDKLNSDNFNLKNNNTNLKSEKNKLESEKTKLENDKTNLKNENTKLRSDNTSMKKALKELQNELALVESERNRLQTEISSILNSHSFKVGTSLMYLPHQIKKIITRGSE